MLRQMTPVALYAAPFCASGWTSSNAGPAADHRARRKPYGTHVQPKEQRLWTTSLDSPAAAPNQAPAQRSRTLPRGRPRCAANRGAHIVPRIKWPSVAGRIDNRTQNNCAPAIATPIASKLAIYAFRTTVSGMDSAAPSAIGLPLWMSAMDCTMQQSRGYC